MKRKLNKSYVLDFLVLIFLFFGLTVHAQQDPFIAGLINDEVSYCDIEPDSVIHQAPVNQSAIWYMYLDLDNDGLDDFLLDVFTNTHNGFQETHVIWSQSFYAETIFKDYGILVTANQNDTIYLPIAQPFTIGDTIPGNTSSYHGATYLYHEMLDPWSGTCNINTWKGIGPAFIGLKINYPDDPVLGWIEVEIPDSTGTNLIVKGFAVNKPNIYSKINNNEQHMFRVFPNPVHNKATLIFSKNINGSNYSVRIFSLNGIAFNAPYSANSNHLLINLEDLPMGLYILEIQLDGQLEYQKFLKR